MTRLPEIKKKYNCLFSIQDPGLEKMKKSGFLADFTVAMIPDQEQPADMDWAFLLQNLSYPPIKGKSPSPVSPKIG